MGWCEYLPIAITFESQSQVTLPRTLSVFEMFLKHSSYFNSRPSRIYRRLLHHRTDSAMGGFFRFSNVIGGELKSSDNLGRGINPSTKQPLWDVPVSSEKDIDDAVLASREAFKSWSKSSWEQRRLRLLESREILLANSAEMAELITKEGGKPVRKPDSNYKYGS